MKHTTLGRARTRLALLAGAFTMAVGAAPGFAATPPQADLAITPVSTSATTVANGGDVTVTMTVVNRGPDAADATLVDAVVDRPAFIPLVSGLLGQPPNGAQITLATWGGTLGDANVCSLNANANAATCALGTLASGSSTLVVVHIHAALTTIVVADVVTLALPSAQFVNTAAVASTNTVDPAPVTLPGATVVSDNVVTQTVTVTGCPGIVC